MKYLFVGEKRSKRAKQLNVTWKDGKLAGKHLYEALNRMNIDVEHCGFRNIFRELDDKEIVNKTALRDIKKFNGIIIGMGRKVESVLKKEGINHVFIFHPASRGTIRKIDNYCKHVKESFNEIN